MTYYEVTDLERELLSDLTEKQIHEMKSCLGLRYKKKPYRNYFTTRVINESWNDLIDKGYATRTDRVNESNITTFYLTKKGVEHVMMKEVTDKLYRLITY